jgi:glycosyltransferase involved in cell wall biosynthesis
MMRDSRTVVSAFHLKPRRVSTLEEYGVFLTRALERKGCKSVLIFQQAPIAEMLARFEGTQPEIEVFDGAHRPANALKFLRLLRKHRPDVVHYHFYTPFSLLPILAKAAGARSIIFTEHVRQPKQLHPAVRLAMRAWDRIVLAPLGVRMLAVSEHVSHVLTSNFEIAPQRVQVLHNGVNLERFAPLGEREREAVRAELNVPTQACVIVCVAWFRAEKGLDDLLRAAQAVIAARPEAVFVIVGDGPLEVPLKELARSLGIASNVRFTGLRFDVERMMGMADIVAIPSVWQEPAALVNSEAMAMERPVVATRVGGNPELIDDGVTGRLVEPREPRQLAAALLELLDSPAYMAELGRAGRRRVARLFSMDRWIADTVRIFGDSPGD